MHLQERPQPVAIRWPDALAFREAIQHPASTLAEARLQEAQVQADRQGLPVAWSGRFAVVFRLAGEEGESWALRCFTSPGDPLRAARYRLIERHLQRLPGLFVPFRYLERGIRSAGRWYPAVRMEWADGVPLGRWVAENVDRPDALRRLAATLGRALERLEAAGIAHGDWQHDNLLVSGDGARVTLVDYDGLFVPELTGYPSPELGHPNYQHPARTERHFGVGLDRFACLSLQVALRALARQPALLERFGDGESLLFTRADFADPKSSPLFATLGSRAEGDRDEALAEALVRLVDACSRRDGAGLLPAVSSAPPEPLPVFAVATNPGGIPGERFWWHGAPLFDDFGDGAALRFASHLEDPEQVEADERHRIQIRGLAFGLGVALFLAGNLVLRDWFVGWVYPLMLLSHVLSARVGYALWPLRAPLSALEDEIAWRRRKRFSLYNDLLATRDRKAAAAVRERMAALDRALVALADERAKFPELSLGGYRRWLGQARPR